MIRRLIGTMVKLQFIGSDPACGVEIHDNEHQDEGSWGRDTEQNPGPSGMGFEWIFLGHVCPNLKFLKLPFCIQPNQKEDMVNRFL